MSEKDRNVLIELANAFDMLPAEKQQYFCGYAEGVADMTDAKPRNYNDPTNTHHD